MQPLQVAAGNYANRSQGQTTAIDVVRALWAIIPNEGRDNEKSNHRLVIWTSMATVYHRDGGISIAMLVNQI